VTDRHLANRHLADRHFLIDIWPIGIWPIVIWLIVIWLIVIWLIVIWPIVIWPIVIWAIGIWLIEIWLTGIWPMDIWPTGMWLIMYLFDTTMAPSVTSELADSSFYTVSTKGLLAKCFSTKRRKTIDLVSFHLISFTNENRTASQLLSFNRKLLLVINIWSANF